MKIYSDKDTLIFEDINERELYLKNEDRCLFIKKNNNTFILTTDELLSLDISINEPLSFINGNNEVIKIDSSISNIEFSKNTFLKSNEGNYYIYIDKYDSLTIVFNKKPSLFNTYRNDCEIISINSKTSNFKFQFSCKYFKPTNINMHIKTRSSKIEDSIEAQSFDVTEVDNNIYVVTVTVLLNSNIIKNLTTNYIDIKNYNLEAYDLFFSYQIEEMPLSNYGPRIKSSNKSIFNENDENWLEFDDSSMCLIKFYSTNHDNLSCRIFIIPKLTYMYYLNLRSYETQKRKKPIILCIEYPEKAQDNSMFFFKYLVSNYNDRFEIYYLISNNSKDKVNLFGYEDNLVEYQSMEHLKVFNKADVIVHTHTPNYSLPFLTNFLENKLKAKKKIFLQHGVIGSKDVSQLYGRTEDNEFTNLFVVSSMREKKTVEKHYNYPENDVILTGLARFDNVLENRGNSIVNEESLLIMPTWRKDQDLLSKDKFLETDFYNVYNSLLKNNEFISFCKNKNIKMNFYLHKNFQKFSNLFNNEHVNIIREGECSVSRLLETNKVLITDYSSVALDFALMHKKVIYYRPKVLYTEESFNEDTKLLPGRIVANVNDLILELNSLEFDNEFEEKLDSIYLYKDTKACYRIAQEMITKFNI